MKILFVCNKSPYPAKEGGPIAMNMFIEGLHRQGHQVKVLAISSKKYSVSEHEIPEDYLKKTSIETVFVDLSIKLLDAFIAFLSNKSYHIKRFISKDFDKKLSNILDSEEFDIVQFESIFVAPYINTVRKKSKAKIILRAHNVEHKIWEGIASNSKKWLKKIYIQHLAKTLKEYELNIIKEFDGLISISKKDEDFFNTFNTNTPKTSIPFGIHKFESKASNTEAEFPSLFHLGAMNWIPNIQGIEWFLKNVWPEIHKLYPELKLYLAGHKMPDHLLKHDKPNVVTDGFVDDPINYMHSKSIMIVPLFSSSGIRIKIIEGMAAGKTIISTTKGAQGIDYTNAKNILIADTKEEFINHITKCITDYDFCINIGHNAKQLIEKKYDADTLIKKLIAFYRSTPSKKN